MSFAALAAGPARAVSIELVASSDTVQAGQTFDISVVLNLEEAALLAAYDLDVAFDSALTSFHDLVFGTALGQGDDVFTALLSGANAVDFASLSFLSDAELEASQSASFVLATLGFRADAVGTAVFDFDPEAPPGLQLTGPGAALLDLTGATGVSVVITPRAVPVAGSLTLLVPGLLALGIAARRRRSHVRP